MPAPNIILCVCDQLRAFEVGCYGNNIIRTPNIDRLASGGVRFETAVTNNPVCMPARACMLSGQFSRTCTGELGNVGGDPPVAERVHLKDPTLPEELRAAGYVTGLVGKWHIEPSPLVVGFDHAVYPLAIHHYQGQRYFHGDRLGDPVEEFGPEYERREVDRFLDGTGDLPFFLYYNISLPHEPIGPAEMPRRYWNIYGRDQVPIRPNAWREGHMAHDEWWFKTYLLWDHFWRMAEGEPWRPAAAGYPQAGQGPLPSDALPPGYDLRDLTAAYYAATTCADDLIGDLMRNLETRGLMENTLIVFTSDHGDNLGSHHLFNKDCLFEESIRVPMIFHFPSRFAGRVNRTQIAQLIDLRQTILATAGVNGGARAQGRNLLPLLLGEREALDENHAFIETDAMFGKSTIGIRTPTHLYGAPLKDCHSLEAGDWGFYDLREDPFQIRNLAAADEQQDLRNILREKVERWHRSTAWLA